MLKVKINKDLNKLNQTAFKFSVGQIIALIVAVLIGVVTFFIFFDKIPFDLLAFLVCIEVIIIIAFSLVKINNMGLMKFLLKMCKGPEKRPYSNNKGVFNNDDEFTAF